MQIVKASIEQVSDGWLVQIGEFGSSSFPYLWIVEESHSRAEAWMLHHLRKFGKGVIFAMPDNTLATF